MKELMSYTKPQLLQIQSTINGFCSIGSSASTTIGKICQAGPGARYCSPGVGDISSTCIPSGNDPSDGSCTNGTGATGWGQCATGTTGAATNTIQPKIAS